MPPEKLVAKQGDFDLAKELYGDAEGSHATPSEVAVTQFAYPDAIKSVALDPPVAPRGDFTDAADYRSNFPDGRIGSNPSLATPETGKRLYETAVTAISKEYLGWVTLERGSRCRCRWAAAGELEWLTARRSLMFTFGGYCFHESWFDGLELVTHVTEITNSVERRARRSCPCCTAMLRS